MSNEDRDSEDNIEEGPPPIQPYSLSEAILVCQCLLATLEGYDGFTEHNCSSLHDIIGKMYVAKAKNCKQATLTDYFHKV